MFEKTENKWKRGRGWSKKTLPFLNHWLTISGRHPEECGEHGAEKVP